MPEIKVFFYHFKEAIKVENSEEKDVPSILIYCGPGNFWPIISCQIRPNMDIIQLNAVLAKLFNHNS
jgi:hypothetical protein